MNDLQKEKIGENLRDVGTVLTVSFILAGITGFFLEFSELPLFFKLAFIVTCLCLFALGIYVLYLIFSCFLRSIMEWWFDFTVRGLCPPNDYEELKDSLENSNDLWHLDDVGLEIIEKRREFAARFRRMDRSAPPSWSGLRLQPGLGLVARLRVANVHPVAVQHAAEQAAL